jgi:uncharacterized damage-inducible protein DinB
MELNLRGISQDMADRPPAPGVNSVSWILSHVADTRRWMLGAVFQSSYEPSTPEPKRLAELMAAINDTQTAMDAAFDAVQDWGATRTHPIMNASAPLDMIVGTFLQHEAYHIGQLGVARKLMGLEGALKDAPEKVSV